VSEDAGRTPEEGLERRTFLKGAATVAWATPLILTMASRPAAAASCLPNGGPCDACAGMNCCDADGPADGGCCCSDPNVEACGGVCTAADANCTAIPSVGGPGGTNFVCYAPGPLNLTSVGRSRSSGKGAKAL
jgi:hypothetical protein